MASRFLAIAGLLLISASCLAETGSNMAYRKTSWNGARVHVVYVNLNSPDLKVTVSLTKNGSGSSEPFSSMLNRLQPAAAITGTFFCTRSLLPTGDIVIEGKRVHSGSLGTGICFTPENSVEFVPFSTGQQTGWQGYDTVLCGGPTLVRNGRLFLSPRHQGFTDPALFRKKKRSALGITSSNKLLLVVVDTGVHLRALAKIMLHLGAVNAVSLDGGASSALYYDGRLISRPGRKLTNLLVVYDSLAGYYRHRQAPAPQLREPIVQHTESPRAASPPEISSIHSAPTSRPNTDGNAAFLKQNQLTCAADAEAYLTPTSTRRQRPRESKRR